MIDIEKDALVLMLRSKTALGRLNDAEVHSVLGFLESIGFKHYVSAGDPVAPSPAPLVTAVAVPVAAPSILASLEATIEKDVKAFFEPAPIAPPPAQ